MTARLTPSLHLKAQQTLAMTPQLQQAIKLLQMTNRELEAFLDEQLEVNPLLEKVERDNGDLSVEVMQESEGDTTDTAALENNFSTDPANGPGVGHDFDAGVARIGAGGSMSFDDPDGLWQDRLTAGKSLRDFLLDQLAQSLHDATDRKIGALLIDHLDEAGYLRLDPAELAARLGIVPERLARVLDVLRGFEPAGIFARNLTDCLALQLLDQKQLDEPFRRLLDCLDQIGKQEPARLAASIGVNTAYLSDMLATLKSLNPKPASGFDPLIVQTAIPDVLMKTLPKNLGGGWRVELNNETLPRVLVNQTYVQDVMRHAVSPSDKSYLQSQLSDAHWLTKALDQRAQTMIKVAAEIVERQNGFFLYGIEFMVPMTLRDIAEAIDMHESTVSRVTSGKFIGTPRGIFELKFFFTTALSGANGVAHSAEAVKAKIKTLIDAEPPSAILSDEAIAALLQKDGIDIARRTVAKYREGMGLGTSTARRKQKKPNNV
jgi:RNA polymerase sigma-54 factor